MWLRPSTGYIAFLSLAPLSVLLFALFSFLSLDIQEYSNTGDHGLLGSNSRAKYSGVSVPSDGRVFNIDRHLLRRRRRDATAPSATRSRRDAVRGVARDCGRACRLRLRSGDESYHVHLHRWHTLRHSHNKSRSALEQEEVVPIVQYIEDADTTTARLAQFSTECLYKARVLPSKDHTVVNLCDSDTGIFGLLALPSGVFTVEPLQSDGEESSRHRAHLLRKVEDRDFSTHHSFHFDNVSSDSVVNNTIDTYTQQWEDVNVRKTRSRRAANSWDHFVEVLAVADSKMYEYHGYNLEDYILTLFSSVAQIYRHQSLRAAINIVVVKIIILKHENAGPRVSSNAQDTLQQFCRWQRLFNDASEDSPNHHDVAILLTRGDICRAPGKCDTLGLAELGTICDEQKSCAIIEDNGLSAAFTIAHELGHVFNIPHDDERKCAQFMQVVKQNYHIMAPTLEYNTHPWSWSPCSSGMLEKFLDTHRGQIQCLFDQPIQRKYYEQLFDSEPAGRKYDVSQQCKFVFGPQSELCPYMPSCRRLWCATYYGAQMGCRTQHMPWADGTVCEKTSSHHQKYCYRGECVGMSAVHRTKIDGGWGEWQPWGQCSRTCGGGVHKAIRDCDNPRPENGGKYCVGQRERYRSCNIQDCPWDTAGYREVQCAEYNHKDVGIHGVAANSIWLPKYTGVASNERCKLYCRVQGSAAFYLLSEKVHDGTACDRNGDDICVDGTCMKAGCDHRLSSSMTRDKCGICGGDGTSCKTVKGKFNDRGSFGYNEVMKIPAGSANIDIQQHGYNNQKDDDNYLSLRSSNGEFLLNGHYQVSVFRQQIPIQDVVLEYSGSDKIIERINGTGPIRNDIYVHVLSVGNLYPPDIRYEYMTSVKGIRHRPPATVSFYWRQGDRWSKCDKHCQGTQKQEVVCIDAESNRQTSNRMCQGRSPSPRSRMCNIQCTTKWVTDDVGRCSAQCGIGEKRQRSRCLRIEGNHKNTVQDIHCDSKTRPPEKVACVIDCSGRRWSYSDWGQCSVTCGSGVSTRKVFCMDDHNRIIDGVHCDVRTREADQRACNMHPCPRWIYGHWSECSRSCDGGVRIRHAQCVDAADKEINQRFCGQKDDRENCNEHMCTGWRFGLWSECSATCGSGVQTRDAVCTDRSGTRLSDSQCNHRERIVQKACARAACPQWKLGSWTQCSVSCLDGWSTRRVACVNALGDDVSVEECSKDGEKPASHKPCNQGPCPFWRTADWSPCSVSCGVGRRERRTECVYRDQVVDHSFCGELTSPPTTQTCRLIACSTWEVSAWSSCPVTCGSGVQYRNIECVTLPQKTKVDANLCDKKTRPRDRKSCERDACNARAILAPTAALPPIRWATGPWTMCSQTCGKGNQRRLLKCRDHVRELPDEYCSHLERPVETQECLVRPCAFWKTASWMPCPSTCGVHVQQTRSVFCVTEDSQKEVLDTDCDFSLRPATRKSCLLEPCPKGIEPPLGTWKTGYWTKCSASCGGGWRRRHVACSTTTCDEKTKPKLFDSCEMQDCPPITSFTWQISPWTHCSVTCGMGVQRRRVWCEDALTGTTRDAAACGETRPVISRDCQRPPCARQLPAQWQSAPWSSCSAKCGRGVRRREVGCIETETNTTVASSRCDSSKRPIVEHRCRVSHCPRWRGSPWGQCSSTCGAGTRKREVFCQRGRKHRVEEKECKKKKPPKVARCYLASCPAYSWFTTPWSKCIDGCSKGEQQRRVYCMNNAGKRAASRMCLHQSTPSTTKPCELSRCPYEWVPGPWQTCSKMCGDGVQSRMVECRLKTANMSRKHEPAVPKERCGDLPIPKDTQTCNVNLCDAEYQWQIGPWQSCSKTCGAGIRRRKVRCYDRGGIRVPRELCEKFASRPRRTQTCFLRNCLPATCQEIRAQIAESQSKDGDYQVLLDGFPINVYCHRMNETIPGTYISLNVSSNFAEIYGKRLIYPHTCPSNGERNDSCQCTEHGDANAGLTHFHKIRVDLLNRKINVNDFTFATTYNGSKVPYATAGDCYSMKECPQGQFMVDLLGTGLRIVDDLQWEDKGIRTTSRIERTKNNARIEGRCGGYCGQCAPDKFKGLVFEIDSTQLQKT